MSNLVNNEQVKLKATYMNNIAVTFMIGGLAVPAIQTKEMSFIGCLVFIALGASVSFLMHHLASHELRKLKD